MKAQEREELKEIWNNTVSRYRTWLMIPSSGPRKAGGNLTTASGPSSGSDSMPQESACSGLLRQSR